MRFSAAFFAVLFLFAACDIVVWDPAPSGNSAALPEASPKAGGVLAETEVRLSSSTADAVIYYTLDGGEPSRNSVLYNEAEPIVITRDTVIKAVAIKDGWEESGTLTAAYSIRGIDDYDVFVNGSAAGEGTTEITLEFYTPLSGLSLSEISLIPNDGSCEVLGISGGGMFWTLAVRDAVEGGLEIQITKSGIDSEPKSFRIYEFYYYMDEPGLYSNGAKVSLNALSVEDLLNEALDWLSLHAQTNGDYKILIDYGIIRDAPITINGASLNYKSGIRLTLGGVGAQRSIKLTREDNLILLDTPVTFILDKGITLQGFENNCTSLVYVAGGANFIMEKHSAVRGNTASGGGGGVAVAANSLFVLNGGTISGNRTLQPSPVGPGGGGVFVDQWGAFQMNGGQVLGNSALVDGGGIYVNKNALFIMREGLIYQNEALVCGGGVSVSEGGLFTMNGGIIAKNSADRGGGVFLSQGCTFKKEAEEGGSESGSITGADDEDTANNASKTFQITIVENNKPVDVDVTIKMGNAVFYSENRKLENTVSATHEVLQSPDGFSGWSE